MASPFSLDGHPALLDDWGLLYLGWDTLENHTFNQRNDDLPCDAFIRQFVYALFENLSDTNSIEISFHLDLEELGAPITFREVFGCRSNMDAQNIDLQQHVTPDVMNLAALVTETLEHQGEYVSELDLSEDMSEDMSL